VASRSTPTEAVTRSEVDAALSASRALVAVAARSLASAGDVTLPQYRALVLVAAAGSVTASRLADGLGVHISTVTRLVDRLVDRELLHRERSALNGREVDIRLAPAGRRLLASVTRRRRRELETVLAAMSASQRARVVAAFEQFADAAGELSDRDWALGW
jgi:DNA-binding MarR family transcriptional regulator